MLPQPSVEGLAEGAGPRPTLGRELFGFTIVRLGRAGLGKVRRGVEGDGDVMGMSEAGKMVVRRVDTREDCKGDKLGEEDEKAR